LRASGSSGGHNGLKSIEEKLGSPSYARLRVGIGPLPPGEGSWSDHVLSPFSRAELDQLSELLPDIADAVDCWLNQGIETAMTQFNRKSRSGEEPAEE
jgi:PTH1 family peptidyl-tRNA hydrolase